MKTESEILDDIYGHIAGSELAVAVTGKLLKHPRDVGSDKEDIVISVIGGVPATELQQVPVNVNIYVAMKKQGGHFAKDEPRERILQSIASRVLAVGGIGKDYSFRLEKQTTFDVMDDAIHERVINNRIMYNFIND